MSRIVLGGVLDNVVFVPVIANVLENSSSSGDTFRLLLRCDLRGEGVATAFPLWLPSPPF